MRGLATDAEQTLGLAVERHHPRLVMACSFQKEESVLIDLLMRIEPSARVFTIDTGVLFPETYEVWRKVEDRYGLGIEVIDAGPPNGTPWSASRSSPASSPLSRCRKWRSRSSGAAPSGTWRRSAS